MKDNILFANKIKSDLDTVIKTYICDLRTVKVTPSKFELCFIKFMGISIVYNFLTFGKGKLK